MPSHNPSRAASEPQEAQSENSSHSKLSAPDRAEALQAASRGDDSQEAGDFRDVESFAQTQ